MAMVRTEGGVLVTNENIKVRPVKKRKVKVLDEDEYTESLEHIIMRDYYPAVPAMQAHREHNSYAAPITSLSAFDTPRQDRDRPAKYRDTGASSPAASTAGWETPVQLSSSSFSSSSSVRPLYDPFAEDGTESVHSSTKKGMDSKRRKDMGLNEFLDHHTSEDNAAYQELNAKDAVKREERNWWHRQNEEQASKNTALMLKGDDKRTGMIAMGKYVSKNQLMYYPEGTNVTQNFQLILPGNQKEIVARNTRLPGRFYDAPKKILADGTASTENADLSHLSGSGTPMVGQYKFLRTPSPMPGGGYQGGGAQTPGGFGGSGGRGAQAGSESPFTTWGDVIGTPVHLASEDAPDLRAFVQGLNGSEALSQGRGPVFAVPKVPTRELLTRKLVENVQKKAKVAKAIQQAAVRRATGNTPSSSPHSLYQSPRQSALSALSPHARQLLESVRKGQGRGSAGDPMGLRASYSPSPHTMEDSRRSSSSSTSSKNKHRNSNTNTNSSSSSKSSRPSAADYFHLAARSADTTTGALTDGLL